MWVWSIINRVQRGIKEEICFKQFILMFCKHEIIQSIQRHVIFITSSEKSRMRVAPCTKYCLQTFADSNANARASAVAQLLVSSRLTPG